MFFLRKSTASQVIWLGPFVDTSGAAVTSLTIANTDIRLRKWGGTAAASKNSGGATHDANGRYYCTLDATDTNTVGPLRVDCTMAGALTVWHHFQVLDAAVYDVLFGSTAPSTHTAAAVQALVAAGAVASVTGDVGGNVVGSVGSVASGGITAASLAADCITAAKIATGAIDADAIADGAIDVGALADGAITAAKLATGAITSAKFAAGAIDADAIKADAVTELQSGLATTTQLNAIEADTQDIQSRLPAALVSGRMAADAVAISGSTAAADAVEANIGSLDAAVSTRAAAATALSTAQWTNIRAGYLDNLSGGAVMLASSYSAPPSAATVASAVRTELTTELGRIDQAISTRQATFTAATGLSFPTNFAALAITGAGAVTAGTVGDKTGYTLSQAFPANFGALAISSGGVVSADAKAVNGTGLTGNGSSGSPWGPA